MDLNAVVQRTMELLRATLPALVFFWLNRNHDIGPRYFAVTPQPGMNPILILVSGDATDEKISCLEKYVQPDGTLGDVPSMLSPNQSA